MWKVEFCDIYRDGGSLGAVLFDGTKHISLFLEVVPWDNPREPRQYRALWISDGQTPDRLGDKASIGSETEQWWLWQLENQVLNDISDEETQMRFDDLVAILRSGNRKSGLSE